MPEKGDTRRKNGLVLEKGRLDACCGSRIVVQNVVWKVKQIS